MTSWVKKHWINAFMSEDDDRNRLHVAMVGIAGALISLFMLLVSMWKHFVG